MEGGMVRWRVGGRVRASDRGKEEATRDGWMDKGSKREVGIDDCMDGRM